MTSIFETLCTEFYKLNIFTIFIQIEDKNLMDYVDFIICFIMICIFIFSSLRQIINNRFLAPLAPDSGYESMIILFIGIGMMFPLLIPCLLLLHFLKVFTVWIYLTIKYRQNATKELEEFEARAKRKREDI